MEQRLHKILCSVYKLVNHKTNPECLNELIVIVSTNRPLIDFVILFDSVAKFDCK